MKKKRISTNEGKGLSLSALALAALSGIGGNQLAKYTDTHQSETPVAVGQQHQKIESDELFDQISRHEGIRRKVYKDTRGHPTIGIGFNLDSSINQQFLQRIGIDINELLNGKPLTDDQIKLLYDFSLKLAIRDAKSLLSNFDSQPEKVKRILIDMSFNMGRSKLSQFKGMLSAIENGDYQKAALEMKFQNGRNGSLTPWYTQTGNRSKELVRMMSSI